MKQLTQARINFFTNISHDLKTPLTLVVDPLKQLKEHLPANAPGNAYVHLIEKNVGRIQRMISQLLQFREIESQKITLNRQPGDLIRFIDSIFSLFEFYANKKGIETGFNSQYESFYTKFDHDVIEKIFTNLFSNAIKYASENGYVGVRIYPARQDQRPESAPPAAGTEYIAFTVTNTGAEIPDDKKEAIFESFNHLSDRRPQFESSSGLGLAIVKELVGNLNGTITLRSGNSKVAFTVVLPFTLNAEKTDSAAESYEYTVSEIDNLLTESDVMAPNDRHDRKACNIVVIEDDPNLRSYLEQRLSKHYNVYTAANGSEGIAKAERICPQIVITDLMMPEADGFEVCRSLRSNIKTSHIPVIMLSALGKNTENKIKALECGANVFIDKPFDMDFLLKQVANLIRSQQELKERYSKKYIAEPSKITISSMDEELLKKAMNYIERNMDNSDYNVDSFVSDMSIGRTLLYQKINDITGMSIKEFIMDVRLKRSAQLLRESDLTISEISVLTGFANPKYFSICFKRHFELTPSEFKKKSTQTARKEPTEPAMNISCFRIRRSSVRICPQKPSRRRPARPAGGFILSGRDSSQVCAAPAAPGYDPFFTLRTKWNHFRINDAHPVARFIDLCNTGSEVPGVRFSFEIHKKFKKLKPETYEKDDRKPHQATKCLPPLQTIPL